MKQDCKYLVGMLTVSLLALAPVYAQSSAGQSGSQGATSSQSGSQAHDQASNTANRMGSDHTFVTKAAQGGLAEVKLGQLATQKASSSDVKAFGQQMVDDHSKANDELK